MTRTELAKNGLAKVRFTDVVEYEISHHVAWHGGVEALSHPRHFTGQADEVATVSAALAAKLIAAGQAVAA